MNDKNKTKSQLIEELKILRKQNCQQQAAASELYKPRKQFKIENQQKLLENIYDGIELPIFIIDIDKDGELRSAGLNPEYENLTEMSSNWIKSKTPEELSPVIPIKVAKALRKNLSGCLESGEIVQYQEMISVNKKEA